MKTSLRSLLGCTLFLLAAPALAEDESARGVLSARPPEVFIEQEFIKRIAVNRPGARGCMPFPTPKAHLVRAQCSLSASNCSRKQAPTWMVARMPVVVPDGTPQTLHRAPSAGELP